MRKQIHPSVAITVMMVALLLVLFIYYKKTEPPPTMPMSPLGPAAAYMRQHPDAMAKNMTPAEKQMMARSRGMAGSTAQPPASSSTTARP